MARIIIVGGGILGAATAYRLAKAGADVTLIDSKDPGQATDAGAGIVCPWVSKRRNPDWYALAKGGARIYQDLVKELEDDGITETGYAKVGSLSLQEEGHKLQELYDIILQRREGAPEIGEVELIGEHEVRSRFPLLRSGFGAVYVSGGARVDGRLLRDALLDGARLYGLKQVEGKAFLLREGNRIHGVKVGDKELAADQVIAVNGAWMQELLEPLFTDSGLYFDVRPQRAQIIHLEMTGMDGSEWPVVKSPFNQYMLVSGNRLIVGATQENNTGFDRRMTVGGIHEILHKALDLAPSLREATVVETRVGFRPMTPESVPVMGLIPGYENLYVANGLGSSGLTMAPYMAKQLASLALGEQLDVEIENYKPSRIIKKKR
ncbi:FAD-dependent oxidoreductase [Aciduricibacillus chroicocephali]|uniref:FAD-dependent oxidoreductase n=1 Tax=Aciduricibacillus chroicocephali TaxID=3054939 RepID=A0ABY9KZW7_9BACI|nr:FAD-dependent oxidoreductase [Bacillaceae bacterium 44XB]